MKALLCWRCGEVKTEKRVDGVPVCTDCFVRDAAENRGRAVDYSELTPVYAKSKDKRAKVQAELEEANHDSEMEHRAPETTEPETEPSSGEGGTEAEETVPPTETGSTEEAEPQTTP
jgi:hypothetical protein